MNYIDAEKLKAELRRQKRELELSIQSQGDYGQSCHIVAYENICNLINSLQQEQSEVDYNKFEKLFDDFCERNKGHHITSRDACMWFWELGLKARKED